MEQEICKIEGWTIFKDPDCYFAKGNIPFGPDVEVRLWHNKFDIVVSDLVHMNQHIGIPVSVIQKLLNLGMGNGA